jgi:hypothetical protein
VRQIAAEEQSGEMASDVEVHTKQKCVIEFLHAEKIAPIDIHRRLLNVYGEQTVDVSTVRRWVVRFSSGDSDVRDTHCTAVRSRHEERSDQLINSSQQITINSDHYIPTLPAASHKANQAMNMKVEEASDIDVEKLFSFAGIKSEHEVRCMSVSTGSQK